MVLLLLLVVGAAAGGAWLYRRWATQRAAQELDALPPIYGPPADREAGTRREAPPATLTTESGETFHLSGAATLGVEEDSTHQLPLSRADFGNGELRIWFANRRYIIHDMGVRSRIRVNRRPVTWSFLDDGDEIEVRGIKLRFQMSPVEAAPEIGNS